MNLQVITSRGLHLLYETIKSALAKDDSAGEGAPRYGVRDVPDWRAQADAIEEELTNRLEYFIPIAW